MTKYFYFDANGLKQGPFNEQQLQSSASQGIINPHTMLETETGYKGIAGQIPNLKFSAQTPPAASQGGTVKNVAQMRFEMESKKAPIIPLLLDFSFQELRPEATFLWIVRFGYGFLASLVILAAVISQMLIDRSESTEYDNHNRAVFN